MKLGLPAWMDDLDDPEAVGGYVREATGGRADLNGAGDQADGDHDGCDCGGGGMPVEWGPMRPEHLPGLIAGPTAGRIEPGAAPRCGHFPGCPAPSPTSNRRAPGRPQTLPGARP